ncbi:MAG: hypothetical protein WDA27_13475 [Actinomycetota bacterium]
MNLFSILANTAESSMGALELSFITALVIGLGGAGLFGLAVVARLADPAGARSLLRRLSKKSR